MRSALPLLLAPLLGCTSGALDVDLPGGDTDRADSPGIETGSGGGTVDTDAEGTTWRLGDAVVCADPAARAAAPFRRHVPAGAFADQPFDPESGSLFVGGGLAAADLTGDGRLDLMVTSAGTDVRYWVQTDGTGFVDARDRLPPLPERTAGLTPVDVDDDGDLDVFVSVFRLPDVLLLNDGAGRFVDATEGTGLAGPPLRRSMSSSWADVDRDGDLDGFVAGYGPLRDPDGALPPGDGSSLFLRQADGTWRDAVPDRPADDHLRVAHTFLGSFVDVELDGWPDLYLVNDFGWTYPSELMRSREGALEVVEVGAEIDRDNMGLGVGDLNFDEVPDFFVTAWDAFGLFVSDGAGGWAEAGRSRGLVPAVDAGGNVAWGTELADVDDDGDLDAPVAFGHLPVKTNHTNPLDQPDALFVQGDDGRFTDMAPAWGLDDPGRNRGLLMVDLDRNGFLDLVRTDLRGPTSIFLGACDDAAWLRVELRQAAPNPFAIGARVRVGVGGRVWTRDVRAGGTGYGSGGPPEAHFGLGDVDVVDFVEVVWPDGTRTRRDDVPTRRGLRVTRAAP